MGNFHPHEAGFMDSIGLNRGIAAMNLNAIAKGFTEGSSGFVQDVWNEDPNTFQKLGAATTQMASEFVGLGMTLALGQNMHGRIGMNMTSEHYKRGFFGPTYGAKMGGVNEKTEILHYRGSNFLNRKAPNWMGFKANAATLEGEAASVFKRGARHGFFRESSLLGKGFIGKGLMGGMGGMAIMIAAPMITEWAMSPVVGFVGKMYDENMHEFQNAKRIQYDNRQFNTGQWQQTASQQVGAAMAGAENLQMSLARMYHAR